MNITKKRKAGSKGGTPLIRLRGSNDDETLARKNKVCKLSQSYLNLHFDLTPIRTSPQEHEVFKGETRG